MRRSPRAAAAAVALSLLVGCDSVGLVPPQRRPNNPYVSLARPGPDSTGAAFQVSGLNRATLDLLRARGNDAVAWQPVIRVDVQPEGRAIPPTQPAVSGRFTIVGDTVFFVPAFPFDPGVRYRVTVDATRLPFGSAKGTVTAVVYTPAATIAAPPTTVTAISPRGDSLPANLLRLYVHFSAPMSRTGATGHVRLMDDHGREINDVFLPLDADLWNEDRTRYTLLLDPGRVKTGIGPSATMGRALRPGRRYSLVVDATWRDEHGRTLKAPFHHAFRAGPAIEAALDPVTWRVTQPAARTRDALVLTFPHPLDEALLQRTLGVERGGNAVAGAAEVTTGGAVWRFTPDTPWQVGPHRILVLGILEDPSGNRIGRAFEIPLARRSLGGGGTKEVDRTAVPFIIGS